MPRTPDPDSQIRLKTEDVQFLQREVAFLQYDFDRLSATYGLFLILYSLLCGVAGIMAAVISFAYSDVNFLEGGWSWAWLSFSLLPVPIIALLYANKQFYHLEQATKHSSGRNEETKRAFQDVTFTPW